MILARRVKYVLNIGRPDTTHEEVVFTLDRDISDRSVPFQELDDTLKQQLFRLVTEG